MFKNSFLHKVRKRKIKKEICKKNALQNNYELEKITYYVHV
jgi:hypothetical protein